MNRAINLLTTSFVILFFNLLSYGQEIVVTERGDSILLKDNGTWVYYSNGIDDTEEAVEIRKNDKLFSKPKSSSKKIAGKNDAYEIWYDAKKWKRVPVGDINPEADVALQLIAGDAFAMVIYEEIEIPFESLSNIALENAQSVAPDIKMIDREYRVVNGSTLVSMRMDGTTQGMKITYFSYYFSNEKGSIQFHTFTGQNLLDKYKKDIESLLNGFLVKQ
jgi:hypothetical protein